MCSSDLIKSLDRDIYEKELKRIHRNELQQQRRAKNVAEWEKLGIHKKIISQLGLRNKNPNALTSKELREIRNKSKYQKARDTREYNKTVALTTVHHAKTNLALAFTSLHGARPFTTAHFRDMSYSEILKRIRQRKKEAKDNPDNSGGLRCAFQIMSGTKEECNVMLEDFSQRGYNLKVGKLTANEYLPLVNRNDWTKREFAELTLAVIEQCPNADVKHLLDDLHHFTEENGLPFDDIFK